MGKKALVMVHSVLCLGYGLDCPKFLSRHGRNIYFFSRTFVMALEPIQPPI
jgi:hypothetical protein